MKKLESSLKNMLLVLTTVTVVAVGLLAYVNELTKEPIALANLKTLNDALRKVVPAFDNDPVSEADTLFSEKDGKKIVDYIIYPAKKDGKQVGTAVESGQIGFSGEIKILVGFDGEDKIYDYSLLSHSETPGLGSKADVWFKKGNKGDITGMNPGKTPLAVNKDQGGQIDAITASTITSRTFLRAVNAAYNAYKGNTDVNTSATGAANTDANTAATAKEEGATESNNN
ncbi:RnfABCDGE type electron transport complex subunit G [Bacteroides sp. 519]|uniref:RnfABCDGE type electron transport complex subunit G n=1 Tax=Bacteroides sp. 519 TaxID=2302937 RepID=UPI0013D2C51D|nr:RnfABCDGE type electron transport complex subunit G [Bacteroides sp. 519]NDV60633.1 RnfABCDGE type electron transport complex subunit G [Bacteroides sp. 519]